MISKEQKAEIVKEYWGVNGQFVNGGRKCIACW